MSKEFTEQQTNELVEMAKSFHDAMTSKPKDEKQIVNIVTSTDNAQRQIIRAAYKNLYGHPIQEDITDDLSYKLKDILINMFDTPYEYDARELYKAMHSFMNDDKVIIEIFCSRPKIYFDVVSQAYNKFFGITLKDDVKKETSGDFSKFLQEILEVERPLQQTISGNDAYEIATQLNEKGLKNYGKDVDLFREVFLDKSREDLILIARAYNEKFKKNLYDAIESEISGKVGKLISSILFAVISPAEYFSKKIFRAVEGLGTDINQLCRALIHRSEMDMYALRDYYYMFRNTDIYKDVHGDTSDSYGEILGALSLK